MLTDVNLKEAAIRAKYCWENVPHEMVVPGIEGTGFPKVGG